MPEYRWWACIYVRSSDYESDQWDLDAFLSIHLPIFGNSIHWHSCRKTKRTMCTVHSFYSVNLQILRCNHSSLSISMYLNFFKVFFFNAQCSVLVKSWKFGASVQTTYSHPTSFKQTDFLISTSVNSWGIAQQGLLKKKVCFLVTLFTFYIVCATFRLWPVYLWCSINLLLTCSLL